MKTNCLKFLAVLLATLSSFAQTDKLKVTPADFSKWGTLAGESISPDGNWAVFKMQYESYKDTLYIINTGTLSKSSIPYGSSPVFSPDSRQIVVKLPNSRVLLKDLKSDKNVEYTGVISIDFLSNGNYIMLRENELKEKELQLFSRNGSSIYKLKNVSEYSVANNAEIALICEDKVLLLEADKNFSRTEIYTEKNTILSNLSWSKSGCSFGFFSSSKQDLNNTKLLFYNCKKDKLKSLESQRLLFQNKQFKIAAYTFVIEENEKQLYLSIIEGAQKPLVNDIVEIWDSTTFLEYPEDELHKDPATDPSLVVWNIDTGEIRKIDGGDIINSRMLPSGKYSLSQSKSSIVASTDEIPPADFYCISTDGKEKNLIVRQGSRSAGAFLVSPSGQYISYYKDGDYFVYDTKFGKSINITCDIPIDFRNIEYNRAGENPGYYSPGWSSDSKFIILYDQYDIWLVSANGKNAVKITNGRDSKTTFRVTVDKNKIHSANFAEISRAEIDLRKGIVILAKHFDKSFVYYLFDTKQGIRQINKGKLKSDRIAKAKLNDAYIYTEESDRRPPYLMFFNKDEMSPKNLFQSNKHYVNYQWPHSELLTYKNSNGSDLQGVLMYPAGYLPNKKYPMIVYIYETLSQRLYEYTNPADRHPGGFIPTNYLLDGYFVFMPDIVYKVGDPGKSAADCVSTSVQNIIDRGLVEENHIGIIGHSFGGFEVSFTLTQTKIFAAAVAGGAITDPASSYLSMNTYTGRSNSWRFESQQLRMASSPFNNLEGYIRNSAIANATNITTPLLSWSGKNDASVNMEQSLALHLALRQLKKCNILMLYPGQGHILTNSQASLHLTNSIKDWFDFYLKG